VAAGLGARRAFCDARAPMLDPEGAEACRYINSARGLAADDSDAAVFCLKTRLQELRE